jgi:sulfide:quinone oxidoreductase
MSRRSSTNRRIPSVTSSRILGRPLARSSTPFGYGGKLLPTFPGWLIDGTKPSRLAWLLKEKLLPNIYWDAMLKGREWLAAPTILPYSPTPHEAKDPRVPQAQAGGRP